MNSQNQFYIHLEPARTQVAEHYHSTLEQPNLENVQSMLAAARQRNYELGAAYYRSKYGNTRQYEQKIHEMGLQPQYEERKAEPTIHDFRSTKEYADYVRQTLEEKKKEIEQTVKREIQEKKTNVTSIKPTYNPWVEKPKQPKPSKQVAESQYISKFEKFRENKQQREKSKSPKHVQSRKEQKPKRNYKRELITKIFNEIDQKKRGYVEKLELVEYLTDNRKIIAIFNIEQQSLAQKLFSFQSTNEDSLTLKQLLHYFGQEMEVSQEVQKPNQQEKLMQQCCLLSPDDIKLFQTLFKQLDTYEDLLITRKTYIKYLRDSIEVKKILFKPALFEPVVNKTILLYRILDKIEEDEQIGTEKQQKNKEYITFKQFLAYLQKPSTDDSIIGKIRLVKMIQTMNVKNNSNQIEIESNILDMFEKVARIIPHFSGNYFKVLDFVQRLRASPGYPEIKDEIARRGAEEDGLETESIDQVLDRLLNHGPQYVQLPQLMMYFSRRGRPLDYYKQMHQSNVKMQETMKGSKILAQQYKHMKKQENNEIQGYDSDPEIYNGSMVKRTSQPEDNFRASKLRNSPNKVNETPMHAAYETQRHLVDSHPQFKGTYVSVMIDEQKERSPERAKPHIRSNSAHQQLHRQTASPHGTKITVPQPFSFQTREQERKSRKETENINPDLCFQPAKPREIPKAVLEVGLYQKILQQNEKRREEIKKSSMMMTLATEKPFSFQNRDRQKARRKTKQQRQQFVFKSRPVPWYCSVDLLKKQNQEEQVKRKEKVAKMAQQSLAKARLPPRMEKNELERKAQKLRQGGDYVREEEKTNQKKVKEMPDFQRLQKTMQQQLERKKMNKRTTQIKPFNFHDKKLKSQKSQTEILVDAARTTSLEKRDPMKQAKKVMQQIELYSEKQPEVRAKSTLKFEQQVEKRRKDHEQWKKKRQERDKLQPKQFEEDLKQKLKNAVAEKKAQEKKKEEQEERRRRQEAEKKKMEQYHNRIKEKAMAQPLLVDRPLKRDEQMEKMKKLALISATLDQNGVKGKDKEALFTKEQLNLIRDYEYLKKNKQI